MCYDVKTSTLRKLKYAKHRGDLEGIEELAEASNTGAWIGVTGQGENFLTTGLI